MRCRQSAMAFVNSANAASSPSWALMTSCMSMHPPHWSARSRRRQRVETLNIRIHPAFSPPILDDAPPAEDAAPTPFDDDPVRTQVLADPTIMYG